MTDPTEHASPPETTTPTPNGARDNRSLAAAAALGAITGLRSTAGPTFALYALRAGRPRLRALQIALDGLAFLESFGDKLSFIPARDQPLPLFGRIVSAALTGALVASPRARFGAATVAAAAAVGTAVAAVHVRRAATRRWGVPDLAIGLMEDALVVGGGLAASARLRSQR